MRIIIVNDDGITAPGIRALAKAAAEHGHDVTVYAPDSQRSAASHGLSIERPLTVTASDIYGPGIRAYAVNGTPADCTRLGLFLERPNAKIDFVLSGINDGANRGAAVLYSGTVGAAMEASLCGIGALAVSLCRHADDNDYTVAAELGVRVMEWAAVHPLPIGEIYSLNVPYTDVIPEVKPADISREYIFEPNYTTDENGAYRMIKMPDTYPIENGSDTAVTAAGAASLSILTWNLFSGYPETGDFTKEI